MTQELITTDDNAQQVARVSARVSSLYADIQRDHRHHRDTLSAPIDPATRKQLQNYRRDLHAHLQPIGNSPSHRQAAGKAIGELLDGYLNAKSNDKHVTMAAYLSTLVDQPLFAILQAVDDFKNRRVFDIGKDGERIPFTIDHAPSAPRLLDQVKKCVGPTQEERHKVTRLLAVEKIREPDLPPEERERVGYLMSDLASKMKMQAAADREMDVKKIRAEADEARARAARIVQEATARRRAEAQAG
jgi:hypothetical protein